MSVIERNGEVWCEMRGGLSSRGEAGYESSSPLRLLRSDPSRFDPLRSDREDRVPREAEEERPDRDDSAREDDRDDREVDFKRERFEERERSSAEDSVRLETLKTSGRVFPQLRTRRDACCSRRMRLRRCS